EEKNTPLESFYDGYVVNEIMDACYRSAKSKKWEPVDLKVWRGRSNVEPIAQVREYDQDHIFVKEEILPDGTVKLILKEKKSGKIVQRVK
ncbi:MAG: hypothetical protein MUE32_07095, partial [Bacteroidales bacterium]|nr:hypothetical protein [Bacteroidales bacterium]